MDYSPSNIIKVIFGVHFTLISLGVLGYWTPNSYIFYNLIFLLTILWSIHVKDNAEPIQIAITVNFISIFLDILTLSGYFPTSNNSGINVTFNLNGWRAVRRSTATIFHFGFEKFSGAMAIINLLVRPVSLLYLCRNYNSRMGIDADDFANIFTGTTSPGPSGRNTYEDIGN